MTTDTSVKYFDSSMWGAQLLSNTASSVIAVFDDVLVNGIGSVTLDSLIITDNVATGTVSTGHHLAMVGNTGPVITIAGATPSALNGQWRVQSIPSASTFTFTTSGISNQTATGTITAKRSPAGFSKAYSGTNKAAYRSDNVVGSRLYLRIDDTNTTYSRICGYETMSDVDTGTGPHPTESQQSGGGYLYKANAANRGWTLFSDGRIVYFFCDTNGGASWWGGFVFGDIDSYVPSDAYGSILIYNTSSNSSTPSLLNLGALSSGSVLARAYTQLGSSILCSRYSHSKTINLGSGGEAYPAVADNSLHLAGVECWDGATSSRGILAGLWNPIHTPTNIAHGLVVDNIPQLPNRTIILQALTSSYRAAFDITGPWR